MTEFRRPYTKGYSFSSLTRFFMLFVSLMNLMRWLETIVNTACLNDRGNSLVVSEGVWDQLRPLFRMAITFFYILSFTSFLYLARYNFKNASDTPKDDEEEETAKKHHMTTVLLCFAVPCSMIVLAISFKQRTLVNPFNQTCSEVLHKTSPDLVAGVTFNENKSAIRIGLSVMSSILCGAFIMCYVYFQLKFSSKNSFGFFRETFRHLKDDPEVATFYLFGMGALIHYISSATMHCKADELSTSNIEIASAFLDLVATLLQIITLTYIKVKEHDTRVWGMYVGRVLLCFGILFVFISQMGVNLVQEAFDVHLHQAHFPWRILHATIPLVVDFRLSGLIITFEELWALLNR